MGGFAAALPMVMKGASMAGGIMGGMTDALNQQNASEQSALDVLLQATNAQTAALSQAYNTRFQAGAAEQNALISEINAEEAKRAGARDAQTLAAQAYKAKARQRAALAESGVLNSRTAVGLINEAEANAMRDARELDHQTGLNVQGLMYQAGNYNREAAMHTINANTMFSQASAYGRQAREAEKAASPNPWGSILGGMITGYGTLQALLPGLNVDQALSNVSGGRIRAVSSGGLPGLPGLTDFNSLQKGIFR